MKKRSLLCLFAISLQSLFAGSTSSSSSHMDCNLGSSGFFVLNPTEWYTIEVAGFPATTLLSQKSNRSFSEGRVLVKPSGLKLQEGGNYSVSFSAILQSTDPNNIVVVPVFLVSNSDFDPTSKNKHHCVGSSTPTRRYNNSARLRNFARYKTGN